MRAQVRSHAEIIRGLLDTVRPGSSPEEIEELSRRLARALFEASTALSTREEKARAQRLAALLETPGLQAFGGALTDRIHRAEDSSRTIKTAQRLAAEARVQDEVKLSDRVALLALERVGGVLPDLALKAITKRIKDEAAPYLVDATPEELKKFLAQRSDDGVQINLNYLGEEVLGEVEAERHLAAFDYYLRTADIDAMSVKLSGIFSQVNVLGFAQTVAAVMPRMRRISRAAQSGEHPKLLYFDMEAFRDLELTYEVFARLALEEEFLRVPYGLAVQAYLPDSEELLAKLLVLAEKRRALGGERLRLRLVKGANLAMERVEASQRRLSVPVYPTKALVDANYKRLLRKALTAEAARSVEIGVASHNVFDIAYALVIRAARNVEKSSHFEMLEGMAGALGRVVASTTGSLLLYTPAVLPGHFPSAISYLVRRLDESTAEENFLRSAFSMQSGDAAYEIQERRFTEALRASYEPNTGSQRTQDRRSEIVEKAAPNAFDNAADTDFTRAKNRDWIESALELAARSFWEVRPLIGDREVSGSGENGFDPSRPDAVPYRLENARPADIERSLAVAQLGLREVLPSEKRVEVLRAVARELERARGELIAKIVLDAGKRVLEADIEVSEAVDFANYYARTWELLDANYESTPLGVVVVTPPWNFPLAIAAGGVLAAWVAGNSVILKPAPETVLVARALVDVLRRAGLSETTLQFVPCREEAARPLIVDPRVAGVVLTGATETARLFLGMRPGLRLFAETGGKNAAFVSAEADRESAIGSIVTSAFGHSGQKCSALSVLVLEKEVYRSASFLEQLADATRSLPVGSAWNPTSFVTPLIHPPRGALHWALHELDDGESWLVPPGAKEGERLVSPGIRIGVRPGSRAHRTEFFGPHLSVLMAEDLESGLRIMNGTDYGLTAGFFSLNEDEQQLFREKMDAGNLYINRALTGAVVGRQPFGGRKASRFGPGAKAGGPNYVAQFAVLTLRGKSPAASPAPPSAETLQRDGVRFVEEEFTQVHPGTEVIGEENLFRYRPTAVALVVGRKANDDDVRAFLDWGRAARAQITLHVPDAAARAFSPQSNVEMRPYRNPAQLARHLSKTAQRIRLFGELPERVLNNLRRSGRLVVADPLTNVARKEMLFFFEEQSLSVTLHRYGNLRLQRLARSGRFSK